MTAPSFFRSDFVYDLFEHMSASDAGGRKTTMVGKRGGKPSRKKATVSSQFKVCTYIHTYVHTCETCSCDHLYSEITSIQGPLGHVAFF